MIQEMKRPLTTAEEERCKTGTPRQTIVTARTWNKTPDGLTIKMPTPEKLARIIDRETCGKAGHMHET